MSSEIPVNIVSCKLVYQREFFMLDKDHDFCNVCKGKLSEPCIYCKAEGITKRCTLSYGECGHAFHKHCLIAYWKEVYNKLKPGDPKPKQICQTCNTDEEFKEVPNADY